VLNRVELEPEQLEPPPTKLERVVVEHVPPPEPPKLLYQGPDPEAVRAREAEQAPIPPPPKSRIELFFEHEAALARGEARPTPTSTNDAPMRDLLRRYRQQGFA
jgi:hypothetical protein